ncbi:MAG: hypothetical protein ACK5P7_00650 [Bdellovibrio sp.]|jgi:hypothetical protein
MKGLLQTAFLACGFVISVSVMAQSSNAKPSTNMDSMFRAYSTEMGICAGPASSLCGKKTKDLQINASEFKCLYGKVFRMTREYLPVLDNTDCSRKIKEISAEFDAHTAQFTKTLYDIFEGNKTLIEASCKGKVKEVCKVDQVSLMSFKCLWDASTRRTRNAMPKYDGSPCDKEVKKLVAQNSFGAAKAPAANGVSPATPPTR